MANGIPTISLDLVPSGVMPVVYCNQYDVGNKRNFLLYNGGDVWNIPTGWSISCRGTKPDGLGVVAPVEFEGGTGSNLVTLSLTKQMTAVAGHGIYELRLVQSSTHMVSTINFILAVEPAALSDDTQISDSDVSYVETVLNQIQNVQAVANNVAQNTAAIDAEETARGDADTILQANIDTESSARIAADTALQTEFTNQVAALESLVSGPLVATTVTGMTDHTRIYVYTGSETGYTAGHWYWWNGSAWTDGGVYNAVAVDTDTTLSVAGMAADAKATGDQITGLKDAIKTGEIMMNVQSPQFEQGTIELTSGTLVYSEATNTCRMPQGSIIVPPTGTIIRLKDGDVYRMRAYYAGATGNWYSYGAWASSDIVAPNSTRKYVLVVRRTDWGEITQADVVDQISVIYPGTKAERDDIAFYKTFSIADHLKYPGNMNTSNPVPAVSSAAKVTDYIPVKAGQTITMDLSAGYGNVLQYYDSERTYISGVAVGGTSFSVPADGYVRFCCADTYSGRVVFSYAVPDQIAENLENAVTQMGEGTADLETSVYGIADKSGMFELGNISMTSTSAPVYSSSTSRVRTKEGVMYDLDAGDIISLSDYTLYEMYVGCTTRTGSYYVNGWLREDFVCPVPGEWVILIRKIPESAVSSADMTAIIDGLTIQRIRSLSTAAIKTSFNVANHRGYSDFAPENTIPAFQMSKKMGYNIVETDVAFSSDNVPVLLHDETVDRTSNGSGNVYDLTLDQLKALDFGSWKSADYAGTQIPTFDEFIAFCRSASLDVYAELKGSSTNTKARVKILVDIVKYYGMSDRVAWASYSLELLAWVREYLPTARVGYLVTTITQPTVDALNALGSDNAYICTDFNNLTDTTVQLAIDSDIPVEVYTPNRLSDVIGVNPYVSGFVTDRVYPDLLLLQDVGIL